MSFSTSPFSPLLVWCQRNKCQKVEISSFDKDLVEISLVYNKFEVVMKVQQTVHLADLVISKKEISGSDLEIVSKKGITFEECMSLVDQYVELWEKKLFLPILIWNIILIFLLIGLFCLVFRPNQLTLSLDLSKQWIFCGIFPQRRISQSIFLWLGTLWNLCSLNGTT